jgi:hypothetical protein
MAGFMVDARSLLAVRDTLGRLHDELLGIHTIATSYDGVLGGRDLEGELQHFCGRWHWGIVHISGQITDMMHRLTGAAAAYQRIEHRLAAARHHGHGGRGRHPARGGSGTTVIGGGHRHTSGSGTTTIGGGNGHAGGSGTTVVGGNGGRPGSAVTGPALTVSSSLLTHGQETFVARLATLTGLSPRVVGAWTLAEESSGYAKAREAGGNNNWLNIGYFDSGPGAIAFNRAFSEPDSAADKTADFLKGKWGGASTSIRAILGSASKDPEEQINAIADSDWASSHYGDGANLRGTYRELAGMKVREG